jgi:hypothetical protein
MNRSYVYVTRFNSTNHPPSLDISSRIVFFAPDEVATLFVFLRALRASESGVTFCSPPIKPAVAFGSDRLAIRLEKVWQRPDKNRGSTIKKFFDQKMLRLFN